ncbi:MAG TPA: DUF3515 domain-containing protein [Mycobacteriales bacterium]
MASAVALPVTAALFAIAAHTGGGPDRAPVASATSTTSAQPPTLGPVELPAPPKTADADRYCPDFVAALPITLDGLHSRPAQSTSPWVGAWGDPAVTFRCGVPRPAGLEQTSPLQVVDGVQWYYRQDGDSVVFTAVDRPVYVELTVPSRYAGGPLSEITRALGATLPARPLDLH